MCVVTVPSFLLPSIPFISEIRFARDSREEGIKAIA